MEALKQCTSCGSFSARSCSRCHSAAYCTVECQQTDWQAHRHLCHAFQKLSPPTFPSRPSPSHYLAIFFPMVNPACKPQLSWLNTKEDAAGQVNPDLTDVLQIPGQTGYIGRGLQIVRGNILRGRSKFLDSLNICYIDDYVTDQLPVNQTLHGGMDPVCADGWGETSWKGPVVAYLKAGNAFDAKKMTDMTLTAYRDAVDYLAYYRETIGSMIDWPGSDAHLSIRVMGQRTGKVKGVRINCVGDTEGNPAKEFVHVDVPRAHPLFGAHGDDPLDVVQGFGEEWVVYRYAGYKDTSADEAQNPHGKMLLLAISEECAEAEFWAKIPHWRRARATGSLLVVNRAKDDLDVRKVKAVCDLLEERLAPLLASEGGLDTEAVLDVLTLETLEQFM